MVFHVVSSFSFLIELAQSIAFIWPDHIVDWSGHNDHKNVFDKLSGEQKGVFHRARATDGWREL
jgi:hypothetical protein